MKNNNHDELIITPNDINFVPVYCSYKIGNKQELKFINRRIVVDLSEKESTEKKYLDVATDKEFIINEDSNYEKFLKENHLPSFLKGTKIDYAGEIGEQLSAGEESIFASLQQAPSDVAKTAEYYDNQDLLTTILKAKKINKDVYRILHGAYIPYADLRDLASAMIKEDYILVSEKADAKNLDLPLLP